MGGKEPKGITEHRQSVLLQRRMEEPPKRVKRRQPMTIEEMAYC